MIDLHDPKNKEEFLYCPELDEWLKRAQRRRVIGKLLAIFAALALWGFILAIFLLSK